MTMKQSDAVVQAVKNITGYSGEGAATLTSEQAKQVREVLFEGFKNGSIQLSDEKRAEGADAIWKYIPGLINNHMRKDKRLNGNTKYTPKNPGSRAGSGDPQIVNLKKLLSTFTPGTEAHTEVLGYIEARQAELQATKQAVSVDFSALPPELAAKFSK